MAIVRADTLRSLANGSISGSYAAVGSAISHNWRMFRIINNTNGDMFFSLDGTTDNFFVPASSFVLYDCSANAPPINETDNFVLQIGTQFYVKQSSAPNSGSVYVEGIYARGE